MNRPIRVGFDAQSLTGKYQTGLGVYAKNLARILDKHPETINLKYLWPIGRKPFRRTMQRLLWEQYYLVMNAHKEQADILHSPCFSVPRFTTLPRVVTAHDLIVLKYPKLMPPGSRWYFSKWIPSSYRSADHIIAVSHATRNDIVQYLQINPDKITVIYNGVNPTYTRVTDPHEINRIRFKYHVPMEFFIMVGSFEPRKNHETAIRAFSRIYDKSKQLKLLLVGKPNDYHNKLVDLVKELKLEDQIYFPGFIPDKEVATLYSVATAQLFPSSAEGFGLPLVEAMSAGCPVIASDLKVFHEIGGTAVSYIGTGDNEKMSEEMLRMIEDPVYRSEFVLEGLSQSMKYSWEHAAEKTVRVYMKVLLHRGIEI